jgi:ribosomal protein S18 acetylase RimI-like enzyme
MYKITHNYIGKDVEIVYVYEENNIVGICKFTTRDDVFSRWDKDFDIVELSDKINGESIHITSIISYKKNIGVGRILVNEVEKMAKKRKIKYITLSSILSSIGFWKKLSFKNYGFGEFYYMYKIIN